MAVFEDTATLLKIICTKRNNLYSRLSITGPSARVAGIFLCSTGIAWITRVLGGTRITWIARVLGGTGIAWIPGCGCWFPGFLDFQYIGRQICQFAGIPG